MQDMFPESIEDAIGNDIQAIPGGYKAVAGRLWPGIKIESAYARLKNCLRDDKDEKLAPGELLLIKQWAREAGSRCTIDYELGECHCAASKPVEPETELVQAIRELSEIQRQSDLRGQKLAALLERAGVSL